MSDVQATVPASRWKTAAAGIAVLVAMALLIGLGTWQMQRLHWKEALLQTIAERRHSPPVPVARIDAMVREGGDIEYRPVTATGRYLNDKERHFFATFKGFSGYYVYTPLQLPDGHVLLVNRGFVPVDNKEPEMRMQGQLTGEQTVHGLARGKLSGKPSSLVPDNDIARNIFFWKDLDVMAQSVQLNAAIVFPFFVDADDTPNPGGMPIGGVTQFDLPNNHLQYAVTWYGLAFALALVSGFAVFRRR